MYENSAIITSLLLKNQARLSNFKESILYLKGKRLVNVKIEQNGKKKENKQSQYDIKLFAKTSLKTFILKLQFCKLKKEFIPYPPLIIFFISFCSNGQFSTTPKNVLLHKGPITINHSNFNPKRRKEIHSFHSLS